MSTVARPFSPMTERDTAVEWSSSCGDGGVGVIGTDATRGGEDVRRTFATPAAEITVNDGR